MKLVIRSCRLLCATLLILQLSDPAFQAKEQSKQGSHCTIGVTYPFAQPAINWNGEISKTVGVFEFGITNHDCPSKDGDMVRVGVAPIDKATGVSGGHWPVVSGGHWGPDEVGWIDGSAEFYQEMRPLMDLPLPCEFRLFQRLSISCPDGSSTVYRESVLLRGIVGATSISSERDTVLETR